MSATDEIATVDDIIQLYKDFGSNDYIGEAVTQEEHAIQAALSAKDDGYGDEEICAALLHDIGHLVGTKYAGHERMAEFGVYGHENLGLTLLRRLHFNEKVCDLVGSHVNAKRYLVTTEKSYYDNLSEASKQTFKYQGGLMTDEEVQNFRAKPSFELCLKLRTWDDRAKVPNMPIPTFASFRDLMCRCITKP